MSSRRRGPGRPTLQEAAERDAQLLDKALELFVANGFERTTIEAITTAVGMAKRTVYARYGDKALPYREQDAREREAAALADFVIDDLAELLDVLAVLNGTSQPAAPGTRP